MYMVKTYLAKSSIEGVGVFAGEDIARGTVVWQWIDGIDRRFAPTQVETLPAAARDYIERHAYIMDGIYWLCGDNGKYTNHSDAPNMMEGPGDSEIAVRDIKCGEEITSDYRLFNTQEHLEMLGIAPMKKLMAANG